MAKKALPKETCMICCTQPCECKTERRDKRIRNQQVEVNDANK